MAVEDVEGKPPVFFFLEILRVVEREGGTSALRIYCLRKMCI